MAKNRSRRLRKKMHIEEFREVGIFGCMAFPGRYIWRAGRSNR